MNEYVEFTGEETEVEFLEKCLEQWKLSHSEDFTGTMMILGSLFSEIHHRIDKLKEKTE